MNKVTDGEKKCLEIYLRQSLPLEASETQVISSLHRAVLSEFLYEILIPKKCTGDNYLKIPKFKTTSFPLIGESVNYEIIMQKMESVLTSGHLINLNFCPRFKYIEKYGREVCQGHAVVISGMKEVCTKDKKCKTMMKIQNSYGKSWQKYNNDGWVLAKPLIDSALRRNNESRRDNILSWITSPEVSISTTQRRNYQENTYRPKRRRTVNPLLLRRNTGRRRSSGQGTPVFKCAGESGFSYRNKGQHCRIVRYVR